MTDSLYQSILQACMNMQTILTNADPAPVKSALGRSRKRLEDLALLLSPGADPILEDIAREAARITRMRFGNVIQIYAPLYISNECAGNCPYCGFQHSAGIKRRTLSLDEIESECQHLRATGIRHVLLVSGDSPKTCGVEFIRDAVSRAAELMSSVVVEVPPLSVEDYRSLAQSGADGVTLYQETYDRERFENLHHGGSKADFLFRLTALDRAGEAGIQKLSLGALWGLSPWRREALALGLHAAHLQKKWWRSQVIIGLPRLHNVPASFNIDYPLDDRSLVNIIVALRLFLEDAGIVLSTRESAELRKNLLPIGITQMSAGSKTAPGGYGASDESGEQFSINDERDPVTVGESLLDLGFEPVWKDWDDGFRSIGDTHD